MKKAIFAVITVLLALVMVTCDLNPPLPEKGSNLVYDKDGQLLGIRLSVNVGNAGRAMTATLAKDWVNYYEVAFKDTSSKIYRARWKAGDIGTIMVPLGTYAAVTDAIMFAGRYESKTLLAIGELTLPSGGVITSATTSLTFTLTPLTTDVKPDPTSTFAITAGPSTLTSSFTTSNFPTVTYNNKPAPVFYVKNDDSNKATYTIGGNTHFAGVFVAGSATFTPSAAEVGRPSDVNDGAVPAITVTPNTSTPLTTALPAGGAILLDIDVPATAAKNLYSLAFSIPVRAISQTDTTGDLWFIKGGLDNSSYDLGATANSLGGAILLGIEDIATSLATLTIVVLAP